jgi:hypothetical protein
MLDLPKKIFMKHFFIFFIALTLGSSTSFAASCVSGTLASYISLGSTGCTIGTNTLSNFVIPDDTTTGATEIDPSTILISATGGSFNPTLAATTSVAASAGMLLEALFTYQLRGNLYTSENISLSNSSEDGDGAVTDIQNYCLGGTFSGDALNTCSGTPGSLLTLDGLQNTDSVSSLGQSLVSVVDDLTIDGGLAGSASGGKIVDAFSAVPEPASLFVIGIVLIVAAGAGMRKNGLLRR